MSNDARSYREVRGLICSFVSSGFYLFVTITNASTLHVIKWRYVTASFRWIFISKTEFIWEAFALFKLKRVLKMSQVFFKHPVLNTWLFQLSIHVRNVFKRFKRCVITNDFMKVQLQAESMIMVIKRRHWQVKNKKK